MEEPIFFGSNPSYTQEEESIWELLAYCHKDCQIANQPVLHQLLFHSKFVRYQKEQKRLAMKLGSM